MAPLHKIWEPQMRGTGNMHAHITADQSAFEIVIQDRDALETATDITNSDLYVNTLISHFKRGALQAGNGLTREANKSQSFLSNVENSLCGRTPQQAIQVCCIRRNGKTNQLYLVSTANGKLVPVFYKISDCIQ